MHTAVYRVRCFNPHILYWLFVIIIFPQFADLYRVFAFPCTLAIRSGVYLVVVVVVVEVGLILTKITT